VKRVTEEITCITSGTLVTAVLTNNECMEGEKNPQKVSIVRKCVLNNVKFIHKVLSELEVSLPLSASQRTKVVNIKKWKRSLKT